MNAQEVVAGGVKLHREQQGLTQSDLADALAAHGEDLHSTAIVRIEKADRGVRVGELLALAAALERTPADLLAPKYGRSLTLGSRELTASQVVAWFAGDVKALDHTTADLKTIAKQVRNRRLLSDLAEEMELIAQAVDVGDRRTVIWGTARMQATLAELVERTMTDEEIRELADDYGLEG